MRWDASNVNSDVSLRGNTSNVTDMSYMFREADKLIEYKFDIEYSNKPRPLV